MVAHISSKGIGYPYVGTVLHFTASIKHDSFLNAIPKVIHYNITFTYVVHTSPSRMHPDSYPNVTVRLVDGLSAAEGRVEVNYGGTWGTVCNDSFWDFNDAMVVCRMLGYSSVLAAHVKYGQGSGSVWMSSLACTGSESSISECPHIGWGQTSCSHSQDAGVTCGSE